MDMWLGTRSAWHSKSLELHVRCQRAICSFQRQLHVHVHVFTRCALIRTNGLLYTHAVETESTCL